MKLRTWPMLTIGFGTLLLLIALSGWGALWRAHQTFAEASAMNEAFRRSQRILNDVHADILLSDLLVRDYLLDVSQLMAPRYRQELRDLRVKIAGQLDELKAMESREGAARIEKLDGALEAYWKSLDPLFEWTQRQKMALSWVFLQRHVLPRREALVAITQELRSLNRTHLEDQQRRLDAKQAELPAYIGRTLGAAILLGFVVATLTVYRTTTLERRTEDERARAQSAEEELRRLSQQLVHAQEEERRVISRELHDEVGQTLTALRMEMRNLGELRANEGEFHKLLDETKGLAEQALRTVRDLAMLLRPAMLDDLGLGPAVEWQARQHSRRYGVPVTTQIEGDLDRLPDKHRTCVYRVVQEALTNCARHANAKEIRVGVHGHAGGVSVMIQDDGAGFGPRQQREGLGLVGIDERVRELGGKVNVYSQPGKGTTVTVEVPVTAEVGLA